MDGCDGGAAGDVFTLRIDERRASEQLLAQEAERFQLEHFIPRLQIVDEQEAVRFPRRLLVQLVELLLRQQGAELLHHGVQLVLVAQPPAAEELHFHPHGCADEPQLLRAHPGTDLHAPAPDEESVQGAVRLVQLRRVSKVVDDYKHLVQFLHFHLLGRLRDLALLLDDAPQRRLVPLVPKRLLPLCVHPQVLLNVLLDGDPAVVYVDTRAEDVNFSKTPRYCSRIRLIRATVLPDFDGPRKMTGSEGCLLLYSDLPHFLCVTCQIWSWEAVRVRQKCGVPCYTAVRSRCFPG